MDKRKLLERFVELVRQARRIKSEIKDMQPELEELPNGTYRVGEALVRVWEQPSRNRSGGFVKKQEIIDLENCEVL